MLVAPCRTCTRRRFAAVVLASLLAIPAPAAAGQPAAGGPPDPSTLPRLLRDGRALALAPKDFDLLLVLVRLRDRVVGKEELLRIVWPDVVVEESNLSQHVFTLRHWLGDTAEGARFIETLPRYGYRFVAEVRELAVAGNAVGKVAAVEGQPPPASAHDRPLRRLRRRAWLWAGAATVAILAAGLAGALLARRGALSPTPRLQPLTDRRGIVYAARFDPGGTAVYYSAAWDGGPSRIYVTRRASTAPRSIRWKVASGVRWAISARFTSRSSGATTAAASTGIRSISRGRR